MKKQFLVGKNLIAITFSSLITTVVHAQLDIDIDLGKAKWYEDPKVWVGVAIFLVVLTFIARGRKK